MSTLAPCLSCGACCAHYRASFYWAEAEDASPGGVPVELTEPLGPHTRVMRGTNANSPRCVALAGVVGRAVACAIYEGRSSVCRDFVPSWRDGRHEPRCDAARAAHGLPPLTPEDWSGDGAEPRTAGPAARGAAAAASRALPGQ